MSRPSRGRVCPLCLVPKEPLLCPGPYAGFLSLRIANASDLSFVTAFVRSSPNRGETEVDHRVKERSRPSTRRTSLIDGAWSPGGRARRGRSPTGCPCCWRRSTPARSRRGADYTSPLVTRVNGKGRLWLSSSSRRSTRCKISIGFLPLMPACRVDGVTI